MVRGSGLFLSIRIGVEAHNCAGFQDTPQATSKELSVQFQTTTPEGYQILKLAVMTIYGNQSNVNLVSPTFVTEVLGIGIQPWETTISTPQFEGGSQAIRGYVDLYWSPEGTSNFNWTRFMVVKHQDPPFDVILGHTDATACGLV